MNPDKCPICGSASNTEAWIDGGPPLGSVWQCQRCGTYRLSNFAKMVLDASTVEFGKKLSQRQIANLSGWLRENQVATLTKDNFDELLRLPTPSVAERAEKLLIHFGRTFPTPNQTVTTSVPNAVLPCDLLGVSWSADSAECSFLIFDYLLNTTKMLMHLGAHNLSLKISPQGWAFLDDLRKTNKGSKMAFVAMNFDKEFNTFYEQGIEPAIRDAGYEPKRVDQHDHVNRIDDEIVALINRSRFIVADFTGQKAGVYFEAGYALGLGLKVIWSCREDEIKEKLLHFDTAHFNMLGWTADTLPDYRVRLKNRIEAVIR